VLFAESAIIHVVTAEEQTRDRTTAAIVVTGLVKRYGDVTAVDGLDFFIEAGKLTSILGANGAGKTTTLEIMEGLRTADAGEIRILGRSPQQARRITGVQLQEGTLYEDLSCLETLRFFGRMYGCSVDGMRLLSLVGLEEKGRLRANQLSGGQKRRLQMAIALVNDPEVVILDEPTTGLDPVTRRETWNLISSLKEDGRTVVLTTHYIDEAEALSDWVIIVDRGKVVTQGTPRSLVSAGGHTAHVELDVRDSAVMENLAAIPGGRREGDRWVADTADPAGMVQRLAEVASRETMATLRIRSRSLEDVFLETAGYQLGTQGPE